jgi:tRNA pseudouridine38-40 synthase
VHARGQVIGFNTAWRHSLADLQRALNAVLDPDVVVLELQLAPPEWHPRFSAVRRYYRYTVLNEALRSPLDRRYAHRVPEPLDLTALCTASEYLIGQHDFASFGRPMPRRLGATGSGSTVRRVFSAGWQQDGPWFTFDIVGNAFLRGMVRSLVGTLLEVGKRTWSVDRFVSVLTACNRAMAAPPAPACGLCLMRIDYDGQIYKEQQT